MAELQACEEDARSKDLPVKPTLVSETVAYSCFLCFIRLRKKGIG
jgi:hypothetical protein